MCTTTDEVLRELYEVKDRLAKEFDYDIDRIIEDEKRKSKAAGRVVVPSPVKPKP